MSKRTVLGVMLSVLIIGIFGSVLNPNPVLSSEVYSQEKALDFTLTDIYGETFCLYDCSARVVLLEFFGTWCAPCLSQIPALRNIYGNYSRDQLEMISISSESEDVLLDFAEENNVTWVVAYDPGGDVHTAYAVQYIPTIFIIDAQLYSAQTCWVDRRKHSQIRD